MRVAIPRRFGEQVCEIVGVDPKTVRSVVIRIEAGSLPTVEVERWLYEDGADEVTTALRQFEIVERTEAEAP